jgi:hypothetical protein
MVKLTFNSSNQVKEPKDLTTYQKCGVKMTTSYGTLKHRKNPMLKETYKDDKLEIQLLDITRDLMTSMGLNPLTDDLIKIKDQLLKFIWMYEKIKDQSISNISKDIRKSLTPELKELLKTKLKEK